MNLNCPARRLIHFPSEKKKTKWTIFRKYNCLIASISAKKKKMIMLCKGPDLKAYVIREIFFSGETVLKV